MIYELMNIVRNILKILFVIDNLVKKNVLFFLVKTAFKLSPSTALLVALFHY